MFDRIFPIEDVSVTRSAKTGRTVEAFLAVYDVPVPVADHQGEYDEVIRSGAFAPAIERGWSHVQVFYNHGLNLFSQPEPAFQVPLGTPIAIEEGTRNGTRGVITRTRYADTELANTVLQLIDDGAIRGQSFRGDWGRSNPTTGFFRPGKAGARQLVERLTVDRLLEYGPTPFPVYQDAGILSVRSMADLIQNMTDTEREELVRILGGTQPPPPAAEMAGTGAGDQPDETDPGPELDTTPLELLEAALKAVQQQLPRQHVA